MNPSLDDDDRLEGIRDKIKADCIFVQGRGWVLAEETEQEDKE